MDGTSVGNLYYDLNIDDKNLKSQLDNADKSVKNFGDHVSKYWGDSVDASKKLLLGIGALGAGLVGFGVSSVKAFNESQMSLTQLDAVLKSTGESAGVTREEAIKLSREIQNTTSMSDEAALAVENMGLTFTAIHKDIFPQATKAAIDMATAMNHGLKPSAEQAADSMKLLGKALQDPDAGLGALHRVGVNTEELKKKFEGITDVATKQKLILGELATEFGGSAAAQAKTFAGRIDQLKNSFNDLQEQLGEIIVKALGPVADWFGRIVERITNAGGFLKVLTNFWHEHKDAIIIVAGAIAGSLVPALVAIAGAFAGFMITIAPWAIVGAAVVLLFQHLGISLDDVRKFADKLAERAKPLTDRLHDLHITSRNVFDVFTDIKNVFVEVWKWFNSMPPAVQLLISPLGFLFASFDLVKRVAKELYDIFMTWLWPSIKALATSFVQDLLPPLKDLWDAITRLWNAINPAFIDAVKYLGMFLGIVLVGALWLVINILRVAFGAFGFIIQVVADVINWVSNLINWFGNLVVYVAHAIGQIVTWWWSLYSGIVDVIGSIIQWFKDLPGKIIKAIGDLSGTLWDAGAKLMAGLINGIKSFVGELTSTVKNAVGTAVKAVKDVLGIHSPSKIFMEIGRNVTEGFVKGINDTSQMAVAAMGTLGNNIIAPNLSVNPGASAGSGGTVNHGDTIFNIGTIQDRQDAEFLIHHLDRNSQLEGYGLSPAGA